MIPTPKTLQIFLPQGTPRKGVSESAGINRLGIENERVLQRKLSQ
jgi:hypothetical protein